MPKKAVKARFGLDKLQKIVDTVKVPGKRKFVVKLDRKSENDTFAHHYIDLNAKKDVDYHKLSNDLVPQIKSFLADTMIQRSAIKADVVLLVFMKSELCWLNQQNWLKANSAIPTN